jgi:adenylate cyclase
MRLRRKAAEPTDDRVESPDGNKQHVLSQRLAKLIDTSPAVRDMALEVGIVDRQWLDQPATRKPTIAPPLDVLRRFFERTAERHPSALSGLGLNAVQVLSWDAAWDRGISGIGRTRDRVSTATVVFTDLEGFTRYTTTYGDDAALTLLEQHRRATAPVIRQWGGRVVKHLGDGVMLVFTDAAAGVRAAVEMVPLAPAPLRLRAGVHTGEMVVTADDLVGNAVNLAARVTADARGGQVLVTADTLAAAGELTGLRVRRTRRRVYKGIAEAVSVSRVEADANG